MKFKYFALLFILQVLVLSERTVSAEWSVSADVLIPAFSYLGSKLGIEEIVENKDREIRKLQAELQHFKELNDSNSARIHFLSQTVQQLTYDCLLSTKIELGQVARPDSKITVNRTILADAHSVTHRVSIPGIDVFEVVSISAASGLDWILIQQRINGKEDFYRDWDTYRAGFGSFDEDFFLGLEKIYRLTSFHRCELYIHLERFNGSVTYAAYDNFEIAGDADQYRLLKANGFSGNASRNELEYHEDFMFHTYDRDNSEKCAKKHHGAWWYKDTGICAFTHLNGVYFDHEVDDRTSNFWYDYDSLKKVQMFIRPKLAGF